MGGGTAVAGGRRAVALNVLSGSQQSKVCLPGLGKGMRCN